MPLVIRAERDLFRLYPIYPDTILVNPCNRVGVMGAGLALEFKNRYPRMYGEYRKAYEDGILEKINIQVFRESKHTVVVNLFSKRHWADNSTLEDIIIALKAFREFLTNSPELRYHQVIMPVLGTGLGNLEYGPVMPYFKEYLDDLPNIIHLCMHPDKIKRKPRYLGLVGSRLFTDYHYFEMAVNEIIKLEWDLKLDYFDGIISGGAGGTDTLADMFNKNHMPEEKKFIEIKADWDQYKRAAGMLRNVPIVDMSTHMIAFLSKESVGTKNDIDLVNAWNENNDEKKILSIVNLDGIVWLNKDTSTKSPEIRE
jgi:O-acetyl-ADP-ribose deacetylase (regulator of RNase III)